jgi:hypothetical protein
MSTLFGMKPRTQTQLPYYKQCMLLVVSAQLVVLLLSARGGFADAGKTRGLFSTTVPFIVTPNLAPDSAATTATITNATTTNARSTPTTDGFEPEDDSVVDCAKRVAGEIKRFPGSIDTASVTSRNYARRLGQYVIVAEPMSVCRQRAYANATAMVRVELGEAAMKPYDAIGSYAVLVRSFCGQKDPLRTFLFESMAVFWPPGFGEVVVVLDADSDEGCGAEIATQ